MNEDKPVTISMTGRVTYTDTITVTQAAHIMALIDNAASGSLPGVTGTKARATPLIEVDSRTTSNPSDALNKSGAKINAERIVALAIHLAQTDGKETFTAEDIKPLFRRARQPIPKNFSRDLDPAIRSGWVGVEDDNSDEYYITEKALGVLETTFEPLRSSKTSSPRSNGSSRRNRPRTTEVPEDFRAVEAIEPRMDGIIDYPKVKKKTEKFLWALAKAKELGVEAISGKDLAWLTDRLGDGISVNDMAGNYRSMNKAGHVNKRLQDGKMRVLPAGEQFLKTLKVD